jgi:hypothetical protein
LKAETIMSERSSIHVDSTAPPKPSWTPLRSDKKHPLTIPRGIFYGLLLGLFLWAMLCAGVYLLWHHFH